MKALDDPLGYWPFEYEDEMPMSYDTWKTTPPPDNDPPEEESPGCAICGVPVPPGQMYCGASCEQADEEGWGDVTEIWGSDVHPINLRQEEEE